MRKISRNNGFTLVELLIVVAIIGVLAAVLTPQFLNARKVAADKAAQAFAHNIYTAVQAVIAETGEYSGPETCLDDGSLVSTLAIGNYPIQIPTSGLSILDCDIKPDSVVVKYTGGVASEAEVVLHR